MRAFRWIAEAFLEDSDDEAEDVRGKASSPEAPPSPSPAEAGPTRRRRLEAALEEELVDKRQLASLLWPGVPHGARGRCEAWQMLLGYRPLARQRRCVTLSRKRLGYTELRRELYDASPTIARLGASGATSAAGPSSSASAAAAQWDWSGRGEEATLEQIRRDLPRTVIRGDRQQMASLQALIDDARTHALMERVLFLWAVRQPAAGYVQGLNDVLLAILLTFLAEAAGVQAVEFLGQKDLDRLPPSILDEVEADSYWCLAKVLSEVVDHYTDGQPGLQRAAAALRSSLAAADASLLQRFEDVGMEMGVDFLSTISIRWLGCLMVRELPVHLCVRLWDTCIAESADTGSAGFATFLIYFCVGFLLERSSKLITAEFDEIMAFVQRPPTDDSTLEELEATISRAYVLMSYERDERPRPVTAVPDVTDGEACERSEEVAPVANDEKADGTVSLALASALVVFVDAELDGAVSRADRGSQEQALQGDPAAGPEEKPLQGGPSAVPEQSSVPSQVGLRDSECEVSGHSDHHGACEAIDFKSESQENFLAATSSREGSADSVAVSPAPPCKVALAADDLLALQIDIEDPSVDRQGTAHDKADRSLGSCGSVGTTASETGNETDSRLDDSAYESSPAVSSSQVTPERIIEEAVAQNDVDINASSDISTIACGEVLQGSSFSAGATCPRGHVLQPLLRSCLGSDSDVHCDGAQQLGFCRRKPGEETLFFFCDACGFNVCERCCIILHSARNCARCPQGHLLQPKGAMAYDWDCDGGSACSSPMLSFWWRRKRRCYRCEACDFDLCETCHTLRLEETVKCLCTSQSTSVINNSEETTFAVALGSAPEVETEAHAVVDTVIEEPSVSSAGSVERATVATCPQGHPMEKVCEFADDWDCDGKGNCDSGAFSFWWRQKRLHFRCQVCDFDLCEKCHATRLRAQFEPQQPLVEAVQSPNNSCEHK